METAVSTQARDKEQFRALFKKLTGYPPYGWQVRLFDSVNLGQPVNDLYIPTGGGKTGIIPVWLCAVIQQLQAGVLNAPRRLYYAVDRRIVVDQSEIVAHDLQAEVQRHAELRDVLRRQTTSEEGLVVSVLRGQRVTEQEAIISDPSAFAIVLCTPDMLLSRLLFSAYATSHRVASREAGLVGQDSYIVLDEAHISPAAVNVLKFASGLQEQESKRSAQANPKPFWFTCMTATPRCLSNSSLSLDVGDLAELSSKLQAHKAARIADTTDKEKLDSILGIIEQHQPQWNRLIIYVEKPADAARLCNRLQKKYDVSMLTGTMRGLEKHRVISGLSAFQPRAAQTEPRAAQTERRSVLVCTSAGEVGLNISSDLMITELTFADLLAQRVGRLNRWAEHKQAFVYIVRSIKEKKNGEEQNNYQAAIEATVAYLKSLPSADGWTDVATNALYTNPIPTEAFSPERPSLSLNEAMIAQLANTTAVSVPVDNFMRGANVEYNVNLVVRKKQETDALLRMSDDEIQEYVAAVPVQNDEVAKDTAANLERTLSERGQMLFVSATGEARHIDFGKDDLDLYKLAAGTLYIPEEFNLIDTRGMFSSEGGGKGDIFSDVQNKYRRFVRINAGFLCLDTGGTIEADTVKDLVKAIEAPVGFKPKALFAAESLVYIKLVESKRSVKMTLDAHRDKAREMAQEMLRVLPLPMCESVLNSAFRHDDGKAHWLWQLASRGSGATGEVLAKVGYFNDPLLLGGMRHELVSVLNNPELNNLEKWLILSHHGRCRPFFEEKAYDPDRREESAEVNAKLPAMLEQLNMQYGYWGLAYLEALVRAIDINSE